MRDLGSLIKAYDIRGTVPDQFNESTAWEIGAAFARLTGADTIVTVRDMRPSSPSLVAAFTAGANSQGVNVINAGLGSTDLMYFASGYLGVPGAVFTASHNPAEYNGIKLCRAGATPVGQDSGLADIRRMLEDGAVAVRHLGADPRVTFEVADAHAWLRGYQGEPFDLAFVDCRPGKFQDLETLLGLLRIGGLYVGDDLLPQPTWPDDHQQRVDAFLSRLPTVAGLRAVTMAWASGLVVGARI